MNDHRTSPLFMPLIATICGIWLQSIINISWPLLLFGITTGCCIVSTYFFYTKQEFIKKIGLILFFSFSGATVLYIQKLHTIAYQKLIFNNTIDFSAIVIDKDVWGTHQQSDTLRLAITSIQYCTTKEIIPVTFDVLCYLPYHARFNVGDCVVINNTTIKPPAMPSRSGNPGYDEYLIKEHVLFGLFLHNAKQCTLIHRPIWSFFRWLWNIRNRSYKALKRKMNPRTFRYVGLIFFGNKQQTDITELRATFNIWGLAHFLARAGLHIVFFIFIWTTFFRLFPIPITIKRILLIIFCLIYNILSWSSIPFTRALYAFLIIKCGELLHKQTYYLHILSLICLSILLFNPLQLFFLDFQLSFGLTFALIFLSQLTHYHTKKYN